MLGFVPVPDSRAVIMECVFEDLRVQFSISAGIRTFLVRSYILVRRSSARRVRVIAAVGGDHCGGEFVQEFDECLLEFFGCFAAGSNNVCDPVCDLGVESFFTCDESSVEGDVDTGGEVLGPIGKSVPVQFPVMCVCFLFCDI